MEETATAAMQGGLTVVDWIVITVVGLSALLALFRGFIREVLSLMTWLVAAFVTINYFDDFKEWLAPHIPQKMLLLGISTVGLFIAVLVVLSIMSALILRFLQAGSNISILDSALGMVFGVARGLFILALAYVMFTVIVPRDDFPDDLKNARTLPVVEAAARMLEGIAPDYAKQLEKVSKQAAMESEQMAREKAAEEIKKIQDKNGMDPADYNTREREELKKLLEQLQQEGVELPPAKQAPKESM
jgi:membrane protein required for colicin V production